MTLLWSITGGRAPIHLFGGGPPTAHRWHDDAIERLVTEADVFWNEVPEITSDDLALAPRYGIDAAKPLAVWLTASDLERVDAAAAVVGADAQLLRPLRPWLCAQVLRQAAQSAAGLAPENAAESVLANVARNANVPVYSEMPTAEDAFALFSSLGREAEVALVSMWLDEIEDGLDAMVREAEAVASGDASVGERFVERMRSRYPALYGPLIVERNERWAGRISGMLERGERAFIYVGSAHLAGPDSIQGMLSAAGIATAQL
jgi:uncharacterized protein YbaP (TraB family)